MADKRLALVMPAYNEGKVIGDVIKSLPAKLPGFYLETVVVNDGSTDNTGDEARGAGATVIEHVLNSDSGAATETGLTYARQHGFDYVVTIDADGQHTAKDALAVIDELTKEAADIIIGSRLIESKGMPWYRVLGNKGLNLITFILFGANVSDSQSGLKGFNRRAMEKIVIRSQGKEFCSEIIWRARQQNLSIKEIPIQALYSEYSLAKGQSNWNAFNIIKNLMRRKILELVND